MLRSGPPIRARAAGPILTSLSPRSYSMPLQIIDPPMAAYEAARSTIANLASQAAFRTPALRRADPAAIALSTPHRMAILRLDRIRGANDVRSVVDIKGWRFLVHEGTRVVAA